MPQLLKTAKSSTATDSGTQPIATQAESQDLEGAATANDSSLGVEVPASSLIASGFQGIKPSVAFPHANDQDGSGVGRPISIGTLEQGKPTFPFLNNLTPKTVNTSAPQTGSSVSKAAKPAPPNTDQDLAPAQAPITAGDTLLVPPPTPILTAPPVLATPPVIVAAATSDGLPSKEERAIPSGVSNELLPAFTRATVNEPSIEVQAAPVQAIPNANAMTGVKPDAAANSVSETESNTGSIELPDGSRRTTEDQSQNQIQTVHAAASVAGLSAASIASLNIDTVQASHPAHNDSSLQGIAPTKSLLPGEQSPAQSVSASPNMPSTGVNDLNGVAGQLAALIPLPAVVASEGQQGTQNPPTFVVAKSAGAIALNGKDGLKYAASGVLDAKQHQPEAVQPSSQASSQETASSGNQNQGGNPTQAQSAATVQMNLGSQAAVANTHAAAASAAPPAQVAATSASAATIPSKATESPVPASLLAPQPLPAIHTATLIQNMGQSEMRVGMRSSEFGNISISTSSTRDLISAQISLDHSELAKTLTAHLPEMQAKLGANQTVEVRIDMNGDRGGQGAGPSGGGSNASADQWRGARQQQAGAIAGRSNIGVATGQFSTASATAATGDGRLNARLDIRV